MAATLQLRLLGTPEIDLDRTPVGESLPGKAQAALYYLAVTGQPQTRSALAGLLWGDLPEAAARSNLRKILANLRQVVGPHLDIDRHSAAFKGNSDSWIDVVEFEASVGNAASTTDVKRLQEAVELYRGDFLAGFYVLRAPDFETWLLAEQTRLRELASQALNILANRHNEQNELDQAIAYTRRLLTIEPWREEAHRQLMMLLARDGQRSAALAQFETCQQILAAELGVEPGAETIALYDLIKAEPVQAPRPRLPSLELAQELQKPPPPCPYRGLLAFREIDAPIFFGRESSTRQLVEAVQGRTLVAVIGPSGSGKTSVVFAGLVADLRQEESWTVATFRPGSNPFQALAAALLPLLEADLSETDRLVETRKLTTALSQDELPLYDVIDRIIQKNRSVGRLLLVADQFEELYTLCPEPEVRHRFLKALLKTIDRQQFRPEPALTLVLTLRADFLGQALSHRPLADALQDADVKLGPMTRQELSRAVEKPAEKQGIGFESGLVERILDDVGEEPGNLPLLEFALTLLWARQDNGRLTHHAYEAVGRVAGALAHHADDVYAGLNQLEQQQAREIFIQMVRPGEGTEDTRRLARRIELGEADWELVQKLADARLVVTGQDPTDQETVEVVHEALIRGWGRLRSWMAADRTFRVWQERLRAALRQWEVSGQNKDALLRGLPLAEAEGWLAEREKQLSQTEQSFIRAGLALRARRQAEREQERLARERLRRRITQVLAVGLVVALGLALLAGWQWRQATEERQAALEAQALAATERDRTQQALSRQLAALAMARLDTQLDLALLLSVEANRIAGTFPSRSNLSTVLHYNPQLTTFLRGHGDTVKSVVFSPDGQTVASAGADGTIIFWDVTTGRPLDPPLRGHTGNVQSLAFSPDGQILASGGFDDTIILWDVTKKQPLGPPLTGHTSNIWSVAFSPDGQFLASGSVDDTIILWDMAASPPVGSALVGHDETVTSVAFSPDGQILASASGDQTLRLWDVRTTQPLGPPLTGHLDWVRSVAFSPDSRILASGSDDGTIILWDVVSGQPLTLPLTDHTDSVRQVQFSLDGQILASASEDGTIILWDVSTGRPLGSGQGRLSGHNGEVLSVAFSPDGRTLVSGGEDNTLIVWDVSSLLGTDVAAGQYSARTLTGHTDWVKSVAFSPNGKIVATGGRDKRIILWDVERGQPLGSPMTGHTNEVNIVAFSPDGQILASGSEDRELILWDVASGKLLSRFEDGYIGGVWGVAFSPDGQLLAAGSSDSTVVLWDVANDQPLGPVRDQLTGHTEVVSTVAFSPDGKILASGSDDRSIILWDVASGQPLDGARGRLTGHAGIVNSVAFSPDGKILASGSTDNTIILWDVATGQLLGPPLTGHTAAVRSVSFSPDGQALASGSFDDTIILWDVATRQPLGPPLTGHADNVFGVAFSPDGQTLASVSADHTLRLWDMSAPPAQAAGQALAHTLTGHTDWVKDVTFSPDSQILASASDDQTIRLWDVSTRRPLVKPLTGHTDEIKSVAFSPDGQMLASGSEDHTIILWDISTALSTGVMTGEYMSRPQIGFIGQVQNVVFSPDGQTLAAGGSDGTIILWDVVDDQPFGPPLTAYRAGPPGGFSCINAVEFSPDGRILASNGENNAIILWDVAGGQPLGPAEDRLTGHNGWVTDLAFSPDGHTLASGSLDHTIILWDVSTWLESRAATGKPIGRPLAGHAEAVKSVAFSPDGRTLASGGNDSAIILWDVATGQPYGAPLTGHTGEVQSVAFSPDGQILASGSVDGTIVLWDLGLKSLPARACRRANRNMTLAEWEQFFGDEPYRATCPNLPAPAE